MENKTTIVDLHVKTLRLKGYRNIKEYFEVNTDVVYIGRHCRIFIINENGEKETYFLKRSIFHNPFKSSPTLSLEECLNKYKIYILSKMKPEEIKNQLHNKILACWCKEEGSNKLCHGDILKEIISNFL